MATVIYQPSLVQEAGLLLNIYDMIQNRRMVNAYKNDVTQLLGERQGGREQVSEKAPVDIKVPTGFTYEDEGFRYAGGKQTPFGGIVPTGFETQQTTVPVERQRSPEELKSYDIQTRRMLDALGAGVPPAIRADSRSFTMWPDEDTGLNFQERMALKHAGKPDLFFDSKGNVFDARTQRSQIEQSLKSGYNPRRPSTEAELRAAQDLYNKGKFLLPQEEVKTLKGKIEKRIYTPEERKNKALAPHFDVIDELGNRYGTGEKVDKAILESAKRKMKRYRPKDWSNLTQSDLDNLGKIKQDTINMLLKQQQKTYVPGKVYEDANGNKARYLGNGKWQKQ